MRGNYVVVAQRTVGVDGITPACAGITLRNRFFQLILWDHPRVRGNYQLAKAIPTAFLGSPPRARELPRLFD